MRLKTRPRSKTDDKISLSLEMTKPDGISATFSTSSLQYQREIEMLSEGTFNYLFYYMYIYINAQAKLISLISFLTLYTGLLIGVGCNSD